MQKRKQTISHSQACSTENSASRSVDRQKPKTTRSTRVGLLEKVGVTALLLWGSFLIISLSRKNFILHPSAVREEDVIKPDLLSASPARHRLGTNSENLSARDGRIRRKPYTSPPFPFHTRKTFCAAERNPVIQAYLSRNFSRVSNEQCTTTGMFLWFQSSFRENQLKAWQRPNWTPGMLKISNKDWFVKVLKKNSHDFPDFVPESYRLCDASSREQFLKLLNAGVGMSEAWVMKTSSDGRGRGISFLGPDSQDLRDLQKLLNSMASNKISRRHAKQQQTICLKNNTVQKYVKNLLTYQGRKFTIRAFFPVVSVDPLVALFHHGYLHVSPYTYNATDFSVDGLNQHFSQAIRLYDQKEITKQALQDGSQSFDDFRIYLKEYVDKEAFLLPEHVRSDPASHILSQMKAAFAELIHIFRKESSDLDRRSNFRPENAYVLFGADFFVDRDLRVWFIEANAFPSVDGERSVHTHRYVIPEMVDLVSEVYEKQMNGQDVLPLTRLDRLELVYTDEFQYKYTGSMHPIDNPNDVVEQANGDKSWAVVHLDNLSLVPERSAVYDSPDDLCQGLKNDSFRKSCQEASLVVKSSPLRCIIFENTETTRSIGAKKVPSFQSVMERVDWGYALTLLVIVAILTYFKVGVQHQKNQYLNNCLYIGAMFFVVYFTKPTEGFFSSNSITSVVKESYRAFTIVHPVSSPWIAMSHFATYWFKIASWRAKSFRNMLAWQLLVEWVTAPVNEFAHHLEEHNDVRCMRIAFISTVKHFAVDDVIRVYVLPPFFVYGYLLPKFLFHWTTVCMQWLFFWL